MHDHAFRHIPFAKRLSVHPPHSAAQAPKLAVPVHGTKALKRATLNAIIKQSGLTVDEFIALL